MKKLTLVLVLLFVSTSVCAMGENPKSAPTNDSKQLKDFIELMDKANLEFEKPEGFIETPVIENDQVHYDYALKHPDKHFEVRYRIEPFESFLQSYEEMGISKEAAMIKLNKMFDSWFVVISLNVYAGKLKENEMPKIAQFPEKAVKTEFNAERGFFSLGEVGKEFGQDYNHCAIVGIHRDNIGNAFCFFLYDKPEDYYNLGLPIFYSLKFKK